MGPIEKKIQLYLNGSRWNYTDRLTNAQLVNRLNNEEVIRLIPLLVYLIIIIVVGILGNGLVCYIYRSRYSMSSSRWFIFFLGAVDLILCIVILPCEVATILHQYNFKNPYFCKLATFLNLWSLLSLGLTLVTVSIDRYRKVCKPIGWQINYEKARILCGVSVMAAFVLSLPVFQVYSIHHAEIETYNITVYECSFRSSGASNFAFWYVLFGMGLFTGALITICVMYCFIGSEISQHIRRENMKRQASLTASMSPRHRISRPGDQRSTKVVRFTTMEPEIKRVNFAPPKNDSVASNDTDEHSVNMSDEDTGDFQYPTFPKRRNFEKTKSRRVRSARAKKATISMFLISIAFVISYLPFLSLLMARSLVKDFDENLSDTERAVHKFFLRSYFFNCAINPFIYGISDSRFRENCKGIVCSLIENCVGKLRKLCFKKDANVETLK